MTANNKIWEFAACGYTRCGANYPAGKLKIVKFLRRPIAEVAKYPASNFKMNFALNIRCWTLSVGRFPLLKGRVAESGLRHSTRNRASAKNRTWVRIPPLPPFTLDERHAQIVQWLPALSVGDSNAVRLVGRASRQG